MVFHSKWPRISSQPYGTRGRNERLGGRRLKVSQSTKGAIFMFHKWDSLNRRPERGQYIEKTQRKIPRLALPFRKLLSQFPRLERLWMWLKAWWLRPVCGRRSSSKKRSIFSDGHVGYISGFPRRLLWATILGFIVERWRFIRSTSTKLPLHCLTRIRSYLGPGTAMIQRKDWEMCTGIEAFSGNRTKNAKLGYEQWL